ncbi:uncharacterized protein LOC141595305 [Silene latifolia]|uniref:uncharacterized protein LOC141595305 n=1 Tax=Silene latifolia TaxID=37657 RepID=UPI003D78A998
MDTWNRIVTFFKTTKIRAITLEQEFSHVEMSDFSSVSAYCQRLKSLSDQLKNVGAPVSNSRLVLQLVSGLTEAYQNVGSIIRQRNPLPQFYQARSMLTLEEVSFAKQAATGSAAMYVKNSADSDGGGSARNSSNNNGKGTRSNGNGKKKGKGGKGKSQTPASAPITASASSPAPAPTAQAPWPQGYGPWQWPSSPWGYPPCPYPAGPWARPPGSDRGGHSGILGPRPAWAYTAEGPPSHTDIAAAMYTLGLGPPEPWVMDTGATSHITSDQGKLSSFVNSSIPNGIIVGNGHSIPIKGYSQSKIPKPHPPFVLKNVLYSPHLVKNLISVRKFTTDNHVTIEFDPFGFCVKDIRTGTQLMRCNSQGHLYPISSTNTTPPSSNFAGLAASSLWHDRLGHPGNSTISCLRKNKLIDCNLSRKLFCQSCPLGKHIRLPFAMSNSSTCMPFDIIHCDLWTSPVLSSVGHKYYLLILDDYSNFLWTFPIAKKSHIGSKKEEDSVVLDIAGAGLGKGEPLVAPAAKEQIVSRGGLGCLSYGTDEELEDEPVKLTESDLEFDEPEETLFIAFVCARLRI